MASVLFIYSLRDGSTRFWCWHKEYSQFLSWMISINTCEWHKIIPRYPGYDLGPLWAGSHNEELYHLFGVNIGLCLFIAFFFLLSYKTMICA